MQSADDEASTARGRGILSLPARAAGDATLKALVVTADDFGLAREVNEAIEAAHVGGIVTAASLMVGAPEAADAVARAHSLPSLRVGLHLVLVEGRPVLPARELPDLTDARGCFRTDLVKLGVDIFVRPRVRRQVAAEIKAQFNAYQATGLPLDHVDVHKHFHLHPTIAGLLLDIGAGYGLRAVRVPAEPHALLARAEPHARYRSLLLAPCAALLKARARRQCVRTADRVFGIAWSGAMTEPRMRALLQSLPEGVTEIYVHPATAGGFNGAASGYRYADELAALTAPAVRAAAHASGAQLGGFIDFASI